MKRQRSKSQSKKAPKKQRTNHISAAAVRLGAQQRGLAPEFKNFDTAITYATGIGSQWTGPFLHNGIAAGATGITRVGRNVKLHSLRVSWSYETSGSLEEYRIIGVYDKAPNGSLPSSGDIMVASGTPTDIQDFPNRDNQERFIILFDEYVQKWQGYADNSSCGQLYRKFGKDGLQMVWTGLSTTGAIANITTGAIYCMACATSSTGLTGTTINLNTRVIFTDV